MGQAGSNAVPDERQASRKRRRPLFDAICENIHTNSLFGRRWPCSQHVAQAEFIDVPGRSRSPAG